MGFPHSSVGKESTCNAGDPGSTPGLGRSPGEGKGYPLQQSALKNFMESQRVRNNLVTVTFLHMFILYTSYVLTFTLLSFQHKGLHISYR